MRPLNLLICILELRVQFLVWQGEHKINTALVVKVETFNVENGGVCAEEFRWPHFDPKYMIRAKLQCKVKPMAEYINPVIKEEEFITYRCSSTKNN